MTQPFWKMTEAPYTMGVHVQGVPFDAMVDRVRVALAKEGFGVQTEMDIKRTFQEKLQENVGRYLILGACNPVLAREALVADPGIGALLPCNVMVVQEQEGVFVGSIDPVAQFLVVGRKDVGALAESVRTRLERVLSAIQDSEM